MLGSARAGAAGERLVQETLANLPAQWRAANHDVAGKQVEFAVRLPDGLILPIDSKVVAQADLDALDQQTDPSQRERLERAIRATLRQRAAEVRQYVNQRTPGFAILAVPDAAYHLSRPILPDVYHDHRALLVPYSLLGPFILMVYEQHQRNGIDLESARVAHALADAQAHVETALRESEGRLSDALTRLTNGRDTLRHELPTPPRRSSCSATPPAATAIPQRKQIAIPCNRACTLLHQAASGDSEIGILIEQADLTRQAPDTVPLFVFTLLILQLASRPLFNSGNHQWS